MTSDGVTIVIHDLTLDRSTNGSGAVHEHDLATVRSLDAGSRANGRRPGERVPTLVEVLALPHVLFELELKAHGDLFLRSVVDTVIDADVVDRVEFTGGNPVLVSLVKRALPGAVTGLFNPTRPEWMTPALFERHVLGVAETSDADVVHVHARHITPSVAAGLHALGKQVHANDAASEADVRRALDAGADRLSCDDVAMAVAVVRGH